MKFLGDIIIGDPCEMVKSEEDWQLCEWGERMEKLGIETFLFVEFEEDAPMVVDENGNTLGSFCTDSCAVVVTRLQELLSYNPQFSQHIEYPENWTVIKNFDGVISSKVVRDNTFIVGKGNINFKTIFEEE